MELQFQVESPGGWQTEEEDEDNVLWFAMKMVEVKKRCGDKLYTW